MKKTFLTFLIFLTFLVPMLCVGMLISDYAYADERSVKVKPKEKRDLSVEAKKGVDTALLNTKYYALIIGNNNYKHLPKLKTAIADAKSMDEILRNQYGFQTKLLIDATRDDILHSMNDLRKTLTEKDSFLIYYAGHGTFEKEADKAYWLPIDSQNDDPTKWIIADDITSNMKRIVSRHILIVSDSCYSGTLTRSISGDLSTKGGREEFIKKMLEKKSRTLMASGGNEPVADEGGGGHSVFAGSLLKALSEFSEKGVFTAEELFHGRVKESVAGKSDQVPEYNNIKNSGHDGGDFVFQLASIANMGSGYKPEPVKTEVSEELKNIQQEKERLKSEREELAQQKALIEEKNRLEEERKKLEKEKMEMTSLQPPPPIDQQKSRLAEKDGMVLIPSGEFMAGDPGSLKGMVLNAFYMDKYEVTQREFQQVMGNNPSRFTGCDNCPVEQVTWYEADEYCKKVGKRLPTEWEWEKAAKAGTTTTYYWGDSESMADSYAWYGNNSGDKTHSVGQKKPNAYGLYDMAGNLWEWTNSDYDGSGQYKTLRGGSWDSGTNGVRSSFRLSTRPVDRISSDGFRCSQHPPMR